MGREVSADEALADLDSNHDIAQESSRMVIRKRKVLGVEKGHC